MEETILTAEGEGIFYRLLAGFFLKVPKRPLLELLKQTSWGGAIAEQFSEEEIEEEFQRLFLVPGPEYIPPYESVYRDQWEIPTCSLSGGEGPSLSTGGLMWGPSTAAVKREYEKNGFAIAPHWNEPPDHLGVELEWVGHLCAREALAWREGDENQAGQWQERREKFLRDHLLRWVPPLRRAVEKSEKSQFYRHLIRIVDDAISLTL
ncbi:MAG: molecular chaperone TorD family protein [Candidatus Omnitrophica bacterium]|nr:molecular chaperone TorD family protein [Candidatus Omnitrophota bacterium]